MDTNRRMFLTASGVVVLSVSTGGLRVARAMEECRCERPWSSALEASSAEPRIRAMAYAILAPNAFNMQPWVVELPGADMLILRCDLACRLPQRDVGDRMTVITFGNFLELLSITAAEDGYRLAIEPFPKGEPLRQLDDRPIASVRFIQGGAHADPLFVQALERRTCKRPFEPRPVTSDVLKRLSSATATTVALRTTNEIGLVTQIRDLAAKAFAIEKHTPRINLEQVRLTRLGHNEVKACPGGINLQSGEVETALSEGTLSRLLLADPDSPASKNELGKYKVLCDTAAAYVWLSTGGNTRCDQLDAGRDWLRVHLKATELGLSLGPQSPALNEYPEMTELFGLMHKTLGVPPDSRVQMLGRLGYAAQMPPAPRWSVETWIQDT